MAGSAHHQEYNTHSTLLTTYHYSAASNEGPIGVSHFHKNYEILIPTAGSTEVTVDGRAHTIRPGEAIMIHPFQIHRLHLSENARLWCSVFSAQVVGGLNAILLGNKPRDPVFHPSGHATEFFLREMRAHFSDWRAWQTLTKPQQLAAKAALYAVGCEYVAQVELLPDGKDGKAENLAADVARYISQNYKNDISLQDAARELGYSYQYLSKKFHDLFGLNFKSLLNQYRMERALRMLQETALPITQVAFESGFQSLRNFNHVCMETLGKSPSALRARGAK